MKRQIRCFFTKKNSSINLKKIFTSIKKYIVTLFDKMTFEKIAKNFVNEFEKIIEMLDIIDILILIKNNCRFDIYIIDKIENNTLNNVNDETIIVIIQIITNVSIIFLNQKNLCDERKIFMINSTIFSSTKKTFE